MKQSWFKKNVFANSNSRGASNNKAFTLIELLAIIVILAIIAVITVPIILNVIENSKKGASIDSAYGYKDAVQKYYLTKLLNGEVGYLPTGTIYVAELPADFSVSGSVPSGDSWVQLKNGVVVAYSLRFGDYVVTKYEDSDVVVEYHVVHDSDFTNALEDLADAYVKSAIAKYSSFNGEYVRTVSEMTGDGLEKPENLATTGWIHFVYQNSSVISVDYSLKFGDYVADYLSFTNGDYISNIRSGNERKELPGVVMSDGARYSSVGLEIYYNPATGASDCSGQDGCMLWYMYSVKGNYANMLLANTIDSNAAWINQTDYTSDSKSSDVGISYPNVSSFPEWGSDANQSENARGPVTLLDNLMTRTSVWYATETPKVPNSAGTNEHIVSSSLNYDKYQIDYSGYHARLFTNEEARNIGCRVGVSNSCPSWIYINDVFWTSSPSNNSLQSVYVGGRYSLYAINSDRQLYLRPVITVLKTDVLN